LVNGIQLSEVPLRGIITEDAMLYLSSISGLKTLDIDFIELPQGKTLESFIRTLFEEVLLRHVDTLQKLRIRDGHDDWVKRFMLLDVSFVP
jgi:hypothetical protein